MASLNQKVLLITKLHRALHRNVYLLGLHYPMSKDLLNYFKESMFEKPNGAAFHHLSFYLMSIIDPKCVASSSSWAMFEIKMEAKYRVEFLKFVHTVSNEHPGHLSHIVASWIVNAGGVKVTKLMFELSQVALKLHIQRKNTKMHNLNINEMDLEEIATKQKELREKLVNRVTWWHTTSINMKNIAEIYQRNLPNVEKVRSEKQKLLNGVMEKIISAVGPENLGVVKDLSDVFSTSEFMQNWYSFINCRITSTDNHWKETSTNILSAARKCKNRSEQLVEMHTNHFSEKFSLQYDKSKDKFEVPAEFENGLSISQNAILKSNVQNDVLYFPNLLKSYCIIISNCLKSFAPSDSTAYLQNALDEKKTLVMFIKQQSKELITEASKFHNQLKDAMDVEQYTCSSIESPSGVYDVFNIPSLNLQTKSEEDVSDYWCNCMEKFKLAEFKHPYKGNNIPYIMQQENVQQLTTQFNKTVLDDTRISCKESVLKVNKKPDYMRNIEELKRNMEIIYDVGNKTTLNPLNVTTMSRFGTERKPAPIPSKYIRSMLTTTKKKSTTAPKQPKLKLNDCSFRKTWGNLFNESTNDASILHKAQSSPNLYVKESSENKKRRERIDRPVSVNLHERISGIKEIDYSSFLSELGSTPNLSSSSQKENIPSNNQLVLTDTVSSINKIEIGDSDFKKPTYTPPNQKIPSPNRRKSIDSLIDTYKKFKQSRGIGASEKKNAEPSKDTGDSFLERLDIGDSKNSSKSIPRKDDSHFLSSVPDLLSPSIDFQIRNNADKN